MKTILSRRGKRPLARRDGAVLILALLTLAMITVMGVFSATRSALEQQIANHMENQVAAFFSAEAGISHGRRILQNAFVKYNESNLLIAGKVPDWDFLLNGTYNGNVAQTYWCGGYPIFSANDCVNGASTLDGPWTTAGSQVLSRTITVGSKTVEYTVMVWDNVDHMFSSTLKADSSWQGDNSVDVGCTAADCDCDMTQVKLGADGGVDYQDTSGCFQNYDPVDDQDGSVFVRSTGVVYVNGVVVAEAMHELIFQGIISGKGQIIPGLAQEFANEGHSSSGMDLNEISSGDLGSSTTF